MGYKHNREDIIATGSELIRQKGYHHVGINEILKACKVPKGSFYNFFESKEDFVAQSLISYGEQNGAFIQDFMTDESKSPLERLKTMYTCFIEAHASEGCKGGCLVANLSLEIGGTNAFLAQVSDAQFQNNISPITQCILEGQEQGEIIRDFSASYLAEYLHAGICGAFSRMKVQRNRVYLDKWYQMTFAFITVG
ncbi:MAG: TetR/AcrR family transcriptional regulator [Aureispira sp.]